MALRNRNEDDKKKSDNSLSSTMSSSTLEIVIDDQSISNSADEESNDQIRDSRVCTTDNGNLSYRRKKQLPIRDPKSHRLIEKRRRDRMNACLSELLQLVPHKNTESQRRIEKTEIIEMAINHIRHLLSTVKQNSKTAETNIDTYRIGYRNGLSDIFEFLNEYSDADQLLVDLTQYCKEKEIDLKSLTAMPDKKRPKYVSISEKNAKASKTQPSKADLSSQHNDKLCIISDVEGCEHTNLQNSTKDQQTSTQQYDSAIKVPIFVLHPSGTHYIPMCIDASIVSHAFAKTSNVSNPSSSSSTTENPQCHPVSIPVNFNPMTALSDPYELEIQNINVIATRHQTSVRPN